MLTRDYSYYEVLKEIRFNRSAYRYAKGDIIRVNFNIYRGKVIDTTVLNRYYRDQIWGIDDQKEFFNQLDKKAIKITNILDYPLVMKDIKEIAIKRLDFKDKKLGYYKALNIMNQAIDNIAKEKGPRGRLKAYDDETIGCKVTTSDCGLCTLFRDLDVNRHDIEDYPCPFDKSADAYIDNIEDKIKSMKFIKYEWQGCYYRCKLKNGLTIEQGRDIINNYKNKIYKQINKEK